MSEGGCLLVATPTHNLTMNQVTRRHAILTTAAALATLSLSACGQAAPKLDLPAQKTPESFYATLKTQAAGFVAGAASPKPPIYVVFDAQCPHCGAFWEMSRAYRAERQFIWVPVIVLRNPANRPQGAALLDSKDPTSLMDQHEKSLAARQGGISGRDASAESLAKVDANTAIARHFDIQGVPTILVPQADGKVQLVNGVPPQEVAAQLLR